MNNSNFNPNEEIEAMKKSIAITDEIYQKVIEHIRVGMSEYEISALVQYYSIASLSLIHI